MAYKAIGSDSLRQALHFLSEKPTGYSGRWVTREYLGGGVEKVMVREVGHPKKSKAVKGGKAPIKIFTLKAGAIDRLAMKLAVDDIVILDVSGISKRTFDRRQQHDEPLTADETDRVLRIARVAGEAERVFGDAEKSRRWLARENALLGAPPLTLLATDAGARDVEAELMRIDWGDFA